MQKFRARAIFPVSTLSIFIALFAACSAAGGSSDSQELTSGLPLISQLDALRQPAVIQQLIVDVTDPLTSDRTTPQVNALAFDGESGHAWAVFRMGPIEGDYGLATATGSDSLWIMAADYGIGKWQLITQFSGGQAVIDLSTLSDWLSPLGYTYLAVVCPLGSSGILESLIQEYDTIAPPEWNIQTSTTADSLTITWSSGMGDTYEVYRSTLSGDTSPYLVSRQVDVDGPTNDFTEYIGTWTDESWLPVERDSGINGDETDFYPSVAPGIDYYYTIIPFFDGGGQGDPSPETMVSIDWGTRRSTRREPVSSTEKLQVFADQLRPDLMTDEQVKFCVDNYAGTQKIFRSQADLFRAKDLDDNFIVLGYHLGLGAGDIGNVHGNDWDTNADWPYVDAHEEWFLHRPGSPQPNERVLQQDWNWYGADPDTAWQDYLGSNMLQMLGEDHFDGWFIDSCSELWNTDPAQWWPGDNTPPAMFAFWTPRVSSCLQAITERAKAHPLQPYVVPNAGPYITTISDIKYYSDEPGNEWACDGIMVEGYGRYDQDTPFGETDWKLECNRVLDHEAQGQAVILQCNIWTPDIADRMFQLATYYMVKGNYACINWLGDDGLDTIDPQLPQWYPEWDWVCGAAPDGLPPAVDDLLDQGIYRRNFAGGAFVLCNPTDAPVSYSLGLQPYQYMVPSGGGNVDADGNKTGSLTWDMAIGSLEVPAQSGWILTPL